MAHTQDLRVTKTYLSLTTEFLALMNEIPFEDITVNKLCSRAMIRRATFYKHFGDKYEFVAFVIRGIQAKFDDAYIAPSQSSDPVEFYSTLFNHALAQIEEYRHLIQSAMKSSRFPLLLGLFTEQIATDIRLKLKHDQSAGHQMLAAPDVLAVMSAGALVELLRWWLTSENPIPKETLKAQVSGIIAALYRTVNQRGSPTGGGWRGVCPRKRPPE